MKIIEEIEFEFFDDEKDTQELFRHLNINCQNLKSFGWLKFNYNLNIDYHDINFVNVMQRINRLDIKLNNITKFTFQMDNLTELTLHGLFEYDNEMIDLTFKNLTKLKINDFDDDAFTIISKLKFPQLEIVSINNLTAEIPNSFVNQIKQIKSLSILKCNYFNVNLISTLKMLKNFVFELTHPLDYSDQFLAELFNGLAVHKSIQNIKIQIVEDGTFDHEIFENIIKLTQTKPNAIIKIMVREKDTFDQSFEDYKKKFEETKKFIKINMKIILN